MSDKYVLIVDDDPDARQLLGRIVDSMGLQAHLAPDGLAALKALTSAEQVPPELVLLDLMMPGMDGFSVFKWLRGNPSTRRVPVVVVTAYSSAQIDMLKLPGVDSVVRKGTFTRKSLAALLTNLLENNNMDS